MTSSHSEPTSCSVGSKLIALVGTLAAWVTAVCLGAGCLERPVAPLEPQTNNEFIDRVINQAVDKIDLLFMIDNSISMLDKQQILSDAVPQLMRRLVTPVCVDLATQTRAGFSDSLGRCADGYAPEFPPIADIHMGIITSSLGDHGLNVNCNPEQRPEHNDHAHLLGTIRPQLPSWNSMGFLAWDPGGTKNDPPGESNIEALNIAFRNHVTAAKDTGCGYEASLEAWYRFLIDPEPPATLRVDKSGPVEFQVVEGVDAQILQQRKAFLRSDSLVVIIMLSDENDCSVVEETFAQGHFISARMRLPRSAAVCGQNPNDPCCLSCVAGWPAECGNRDTDPECVKGLLSEPEDRTNLRCFNHKQRFGFDLLYPVERYVSGLTSSLVARRSDGREIPNPLFWGGEGKPLRDKKLVFFAGIVGVPWQDIAFDPSGVSPLRYLTAPELATHQRWDVILGDPKTNDPNHTAPTLPKDPLMIETPFPRQGRNPIVDLALASENSTDPRENLINGHEFKLLFEDGIQKQDDLQYACIFPISNPCQGDKQCDCASAADIAQNKPLCQDPDNQGRMTLGVQYFAKAYPGLRHLQVLKGFGDNAIVASICPKEVTDKTKEDYGYNPAVDAIVDRLKEQLRGKCLPRPLAQDPTTGRVPCTMIEAELKNGAACSCDRLGRVVPISKIGAPVRQHLLSNDLCGGATGKNCEDFCLCEIPQLDGDEGRICREGGRVETPGYCYVDEKTPNLGDEVLQECASTEKRKLRFVYPPDVPGAEVPAKGAVTFIACLGAAVGAVVTP